MQEPILDRGVEDIDRQPCVTLEELHLLRQMIQTNPNDHKCQLLLAKKMVEAASVLVDDSDRTGVKTRAKNRERYILDAHKLVKKLISSGYPEAMFYLADCYGRGWTGINAGRQRSVFPLSIRCQGWSCSVCI